MSEKRQPKKKTAINKKNKIIQKGFELICNQGYNNVTCVDIAKYADVSTGIIYQYFDNKRDIFIEGINDYSNNILFPLQDILKSNKYDHSNLKEMFEDIIDELLKCHQNYKKAHEELTAISWLDEEIATIINRNELKTTELLADFFVERGYKSENLLEKAHVIYGIIENYCHEVISHKHKEIDYEVMRNSVIKLIIMYIENEE